MCLHYILLTALVLHIGGNITRPHVCSNITRPHICSNITRPHHICSNITCCPLPIVVAFFTSHITFAVPKELLGFLEELNSLN